MGEQRGLVIIMFFFKMEPLEAAPGQRNKTKKKKKKKKNENILRFLSVQCLIQCLIRTLTVVYNSLTSITQSLV